MENEIRVNVRLDTEAIAKQFDDVGRAFIRAANAIRGDNWEAPCDHYGTCPFRGDQNCSTCKLRYGAMEILDNDD